MTPPRPRHRLIYPTVLLCLSVAAALIIHPGLTTMVVSLLVIAAGSGRSLLRRERWTPADTITTTRLGLIVVFCSLAWLQPGFGWPAVVVGAVALALDGVDGAIARRTGSTDAGAAYDEAVDALFVLILGIGLIPLWGVWTVIPGLFFYLFHTVAVFRQRWRAPLPPSRLRKTVAAAQGVLLLTAGSPVVLASSWLGPVIVGIALALLCFSFIRDVYWLEHSA